MRPVLAVLPAALCALTLAACGDDDGGDAGSAQDEQAIRAVVVEAITSDDPQVECVTSVTPSFVKTVYGSEADCRRAEREPEDPEEKATGADVTGIEIDGDRATATVKVRGGDTDGAAGEIAFAKDGDAWKVDGLSIGFLRAQVRQGLANATEEPFDDRAFAACFREKLDAMPDERFRRFAYDSIADRESGRALIAPLLTECQATSSSDDASGESGSEKEGGDQASFIRRRFEEGIEQEARKDGVPAAKIECIKRELRERISDEKIFEQATSGGGRAGPEITKATGEAIQACR